MATWKKVIVSGSSAVLSNLALDTALPVGSGGTGASSLTDGGVLLGSGTGAITALGQATNGQLVIGSTGADPVLGTLTGGANITITSGSGTIAIAATGLGSGTVTSVSGSGNVNGITLVSDLSSTTPELVLGGTLGSIANSQLTNDGITIAGNDISLGGSITAATILAGTNVVSGSSDGVLTDGDGIKDFSFDGSSNAVVSVDSGSFAGAGLGADATGLIVNVDNSSIEIDTDTLRVKASGVTNAMLENDGITIAGNDTSLGGSITAATILNGTNVLSGSAQIGDYVKNLGTGTGVTIGSNTGVGSEPTIAVNYGSTANTAVQGSATATFAGTTNEIEVSDTSAQAIGGNVALTIGLPSDVTITQDANIGRDLVVARNLTVQGTASFASTTDLDVADRFIRMASGSTATGDGGIVVQQTGPTDGEAFAYDSARTRWGVTGSYDPATNSITPDAFMSAVVEGGAGVNTPAAVVAKYQQKGNIFVGANQDVYIYS